MAFNRTVAACVLGPCVLGLGAWSAGASGQGSLAAPTTVTRASDRLSHEHAARGAEVARRAAAYLWSAQDRGEGPHGGSWGGADGKPPMFPAITALALTGLLMEPGVTPDDHRAAAAVRWLLAQQQGDGSFSPSALPSYNTAICVSALARVGGAEAKSAVAKGVDFLKNLQYGEHVVIIDGLRETATPVDKTHAFYGGWGYGKHGRPDLSNTQWAVDAMHDAGVPSDDPVFARVLTFVSRCQMADEVNDMPYADGSGQGGFIYATSVNAQTVGQGQSFAGEIEETLSDGRKVSRLRAYGGMTYAGFKTYAYAGLSRDDRRVVLAREWIAANYTLTENPALGLDGYYYYLLTFAKALDAWGEPTLTGAAAGSVPRRWAEDLVSRLAELQQPDGSFKALDDRWMENDPVLITSYALIAVQHAMNRDGK